MSKIFLSCTTAEFGHLRDILAGDLRRPNVEVKSHDEIAAFNSGETTLEKLDIYIAGCDAIVHLVGNATGSAVERAELDAIIRRYPDLTETVPEVKPLVDDGAAWRGSYSQWEAYLALYHIRRGTQKRLYLYRSSEALGGTSGFVADATSIQRQTDHWCRLAALGRDRIDFSSREDLRFRVLNHLLDIQPIVQLDTAQGGRAVRELLSALSRSLSPPAPAPAFADLFQIVVEDTGVVPAILRTNKQRDIGYIPARVDGLDTQSALRKLLLWNGAVLIEGRSGLGKTRELAELALRLCREEDWAICIARHDADARMDEPAAFADELKDRRVLFVFDDMHQRVDAGSENRKPYVDRLDAFLSAMERKVLPGRLYVAGTTGAEPQLRNELGFDPKQRLWQRFSRYELPEFRPAALQTAMLKLAAQSGMKLDPKEAERMVASSDRTVRTLARNVERACRRGERLSLENWMAGEHQSREERLAAASQRCAGVPDVCRAVDVLSGAGLPLRAAYVVGFASKLGTADASAAADTLVNYGLLGFWNGTYHQLAGGRRPDTADRAAMLDPGLWAMLVDALNMNPEARKDFLSLGWTRFWKDRYGDAERAASAAIQGGDDSDEAYYLRGSARLKSGDARAAEQDFTAAIERGRNDADVYMNRALARGQDEDFEGVEQDVSVAIDRGFTGYYGFRGLVRFIRQDYAGAEEDYTRSIQDGLQDGLAELADWYWRAAARFHQNNEAGAEEDLTTAIDRGYREADAYFARGRLRLMRSDNIGAEADFNAAISYDPVSGEAYFWRGVSRRMLRQYADAEQDLTAAINRGQDDAEAHYWRGQVRRELANFSGAEHDYGDAIARGMQTATIYYYRGLARGAQQNWHGARDDYDEAIKRGGESAELFWWRGLARFQMSDLVGAADDFTAGLAEEPTNTDLLYWRGRARFALDNHAGAREDLSAAIKLIPDDAKLYYWRGRVLESLGHAARAEEDFTASIDLGLNDSDVYSQRSMVRYHQEDYKGAASDATAAIERGREDEGVYFARGVARLGTGDQEGAAADFTQALDRGRKDKLVHYLRGQIRHSIDDYRGAEEDLTAAIALGEDSALTYQLRASALVRLDQLDRARHDCERSQQRAAEDALTHGCWGQLYLATGEYDRAAAEYEAALRSDSQLSWRWQLAIALLLGGKFDAGEEAYEPLLVDAPEHAAYLMAELSFWTGRSKAEPVPEVQEAISTVRRKLERFVSSP